MCYFLKESSRRRDGGANQDKLFGQIHNLINAQSSVLDVGCGTGRLAFALAHRCKSVVGIDVSQRNIDRANLTLHRRPENNISFQHSTIHGIMNEGQTHYDYAVLTYVIHEVNEKERVDLLKQIARVADKIIIGDYRIPKTKGVWGLLNDVIEFIAGVEHYKNYKSFMANGGIYHLANRAGLNITDEARNQSELNQIVVLSK